MLDEFSMGGKVSNLPAKRKELIYYLVGFTDAEGCFSVALKRQEGTRFGWVLDPVFHITQHANYRHILQLFAKVLGCGRVIPKPGQPETMQLYVDNRRQLHEKIVPFFRKYKLLAKARDFELFAKIVEGLENKQHENRESFCKLIKLAFKMNLEGKQRRYQLQEILEDIMSAPTGSSETIRQTPGKPA